MKTLIDLRPKKNPAIRTSFLILPDTLTAKQEKALRNLQNILKWHLKDPKLSPLGREVD